MPCTLNVSACRKIGEANYGSRGASVALECELDSTVVFDTAKLRQRVRELFDLARAAVTEELNRSAVEPNSQTQNGHSGNGHANPAPQSNGNGATNGTASGTGNGVRMASEKQARAIWGMAKGKSLNVPDLLKQFGIRTLNELTLPQASQLIDQLKS